MFVAIFDCMPSSINATPVSTKFWILNPRFLFVQYIAYDAETKFGRIVKQSSTNTKTPR